MTRKTKVQRATLQEMLARHYPQLGESQLTELHERITRVLQLSGINPKYLEGIERSRVSATLTFVTPHVTLEVGLRQSFGPPRRRYREFVDGTSVHHIFYFPPPSSARRFSEDSQEITRTLAESPEIFRGLRGQPALDRVIR